VKVPRLKISDPGLTSLKSAARPAIVMPAMFALADQVIKQPQTAIFAAFGSFAFLVLAEFGGPPRTRLTAYLSLAGAGVVLIVVGTLCSGNAWLATGAMAVVGFAILFSGVINGYFTAAATAAILLFVLPVAVPAPVSAIPWRLAGFGLAAAAGICAVMLLWPPRRQATLSSDAARACLALADLADNAFSGDQQATEARIAAAREAVKALVSRFQSMPHQPTGPTRPRAAFAGLADELRWLLESLVAVTGPTGDIGRSLLRALERSRSVKRIVAMARRPFDPAAVGLKKTEYRQADVLDADAVAIAHERLGAVSDAIRVPGGFAAPIEPAANADAQTRFLNFVGRSVVVR